MQALHNGAWLVLDFDTVDCDLASSFDKVPLASLLFISPVSFFGCERSAFDQHLMTVVCDRLWMFVVWTWLMAFEHGLWWLSHHPSSRTTFQKWCCLRTSCSSKRAMRDFYVHRMSLLPRSVWLPWLSMVIGYPLATLHLLSASPRPVPDALFLVGDLRAPSCAGWRCISGASANSRCQEPLVHGCSRGCGKRFFVFVGTLFWTAVWLQPFQALRMCQKHVGGGWFICSYHHFFIRFQVYRQCAG